MQMIGVDDLTYEEARTVFNYDPESGVITWRYRPLEMFASIKRGEHWNSVYPGRTALTRRARSGHLGGNYQGRTYKAHRIAWLLAYGAWPSGEIDHIDGNPANNRIENLRDVSRSVNQRNARRRVDNTSGSAGVYRSGNQWVATIWVEGKRRHLGRFAEKADAAAARVVVEAHFGYTARHGKY